MAADFPGAAAGSPEGVVVEVVIQETGTEAEADVSPAAVFREEAIVVVIGRDPGGLTLRPRHGSLRDRGGYSSRDHRTGREGGYSPPALDPTGPCNNAPPPPPPEIKRKSHNKEGKKERDRI